MNKKLLSILTVGLFSIGNNAFAITDQINLAEKFLNKTNPDKLFVMNTPQSTGQTTLIDKRENIPTEEIEYVSLNTDIHKGKKNKIIKNLQKQWGMEETGIYSEEMVKKVKELQEEKKLNPTGILDKTTWFNIYQQPESWKKETIELALNNWKSIILKNENKKEDKMIVVNIPSMKLYLYQKKTEGYELLMESKVIIGRVKNQTPLHDFEIVSLKYNPTWTPTSNMLKKNLYRNGEINVKWITSHHLNVYDENGEKREIEDIPNLEKIRLTQSSGDGNALGELKFETSSREDIYLHDTNERHLFNYNTRTYSSGCVRVQDFVNLGSLVSGKSIEYVKSMIDKGNLSYEKIPMKVPVYFDYSQVHFNNENKIDFFSDIYSKRK